MEINDALRVFWKSKEVYKKNPFLDSDDSLQRQTRKKCVRKTKPRSPSDSEDSVDQQVGDHKVSFPCSVCQQEIDLTRSFLHKKQHEALATLGLDWMNRKKPHSSEITAQRQFLVSNLLSSLMFSENTLQRINYAFELLRKKQTPAHYKILDNLDKTFTHSPKICHLLIKGVATCGNRNSMWKTDMNDKFTVVNNFGNKPNVCFFGLFDGHHGDTAADLASKELPILFLHQLSRGDPSYQMTADQQHMINSFHTVFREEYRAKEDVFSSTHRSMNTQMQEFEDIHKAFAKAYWRMDRLLRLGRNEVSRVRWSGCSVVTCILEGSIRNFCPTQINSPDAQSFTFNMPQIISGVLHIANAGNVQAILCRNGKGFCLTKEHTMQNMDERMRVLQNGAMISSNEQIRLLEGYVKTTRGLGFHGSINLKKLIIPAPQTISVPIDDLCQFLILATNGLWEVLDKKEVTALAISLFQKYKDTFASDKPTDSSLPTDNSLPTEGDIETTALGRTTIHVLFQYKPESKECMSMTNFMKDSDSKHSEHCFYNPKNMTTNHYETCNEKETKRRTSVDGAQVNDREPCGRSFYESAAEYVGHELVNAALEGGSRDNITVTVIFLSGSEYQLLPEN